jgi:hypothetical protein
MPCAAKTYRRLLMVGIAPQVGDCEIEAGGGFKVETKRDDQAQLVYTIIEPGGH